MTTIIVDDEIQSQEVLKNLLANHHPDLKILAIGNRVQEGVELVQKYRPDLVFLDVEMPDGKGFDLLKKVESPNFNVIFITAHEHYAIPAFRFGALDFLLKPIDREELAEALKKARKRLQEKLALEQLQIFWETLDKLNERKLPTRISISTLDGIIYKPVNEIIRLEAQENYTEIYLMQEPKKNFSLQQFERIRRAIQALSGIYAGASLPSCQFVICRALCKSRRRVSCFTKWRSG